MILVQVSDADHLGAQPRTRRRRFGLDAPLPADPHIILRAVLRHIAAERPGAVPIGLTRAPASRDRGAPGRVSLADGVPDLLLLLPGGRLGFLLIKTQARALSRAERAFADLCRTRAIPVHVVRSLPEARQALDSLGIPTSTENQHARQEDGVARRQSAGRRESRP